MLPGFDGTGALLAPLVAELDGRFQTRVVRYPKNKPLIYPQLFPCIREVLPWGKPYSILADSFSGHLALLFAEDQPQYLESIILCSSFIIDPTVPPKWWNKLSWKDPFKAPFSEETLKTYFLGENCSATLLSETRRAFESIPPEILEFRWNMALRTNAWPQLARCRKPLLYLSGSQDKLCSPSTPEQIVAQNGRVEVLTMNGPHCVLQTSPREAAAYIDGFAQQTHLSNAA
jgi:pimeloyl-ACP methyl ester carboxylesterase